MHLPSLGTCIFQGLVLKWHRTIIIMNFQKYTKCGFNKKKEGYVHNASDKTSDLKSS